MAAETLTHGEFLNELSEHPALQHLSKSDIRLVLAEAAAELGDCMANGYKVNIPGFGNYKLVAKKGRKKGTTVTNPFDQTSRKLTATEPDSIKVKIGANAKLKAHLPEPGTANAKALVKKIA